MPECLRPSLSAVPAQQSGQWFGSVDPSSTKTHDGIHEPRRRTDARSRIRALLRLLPRRGCWNEAARTAGLREQRPAGRRPLRRSVWLSAHFDRPMELQGQDRQPCEPSDHAHPDAHRHHGHRQDGTGQEAQEDDDTDGVPRTVPSRCCRASIGRARPRGLRPRARESRSHQPRSERGPSC